MSRRHSALLRTLLAAAAVSGRPGTASAQDASCTYAACALRVHSGIFGSSVVAGSDEAKVSRSGFGGLRIAVLANAGDSARYHYQAYRRAAPRVAVYGLVVGLAGAASFFVDGSKHPTAGVVMVSTSMIGGLLAAIEGSRANDHLQRAIWHYNLGISETNLGAPSSLAGSQR